MKIIVRKTEEKDFSQIIELSKKIYREKTAWTECELASHLEIFPGGQFVAVESETQNVVGMSASLIVLWDNYEIRDNWEDFTDNGMFTNHDAENGRTLYGAEVMVSPEYRRRRIGEKLYRVRRKLVTDTGLLRIRAGARLRNYYRCASRFSAQEYVRKILNGEVKDPTLSFQLKQGFEVIAVISDYLPDDPESLGKAAIIEWINPKITSELESPRKLFQ